MGLRLVKVSDVVRRFADLLDDPARWDRARATDAEWCELSRVLSVMRNYAWIHLEEDVAPQPASLGKGPVVL